MDIANILRFLIYWLNAKVVPMEAPKQSERDPRMKTLLQIRSSIFADNGQSTQLANRFIEKWRAANPGSRVIVRALALQPIPHIDAARFGAFLAKTGERTAAQAEVVRESDALIDEL